MLYSNKGFQLKHDEPAVAENATNVMTSVELLEWAAKQDNFLAGLQDRKAAAAAKRVLLTYGLSLRKAGLFHIADAAWDFSQRANLCYHYAIDSFKLPFLALQASRCFQQCSHEDFTNPDFEKQIFALIDQTYETMAIPGSGKPIDLFYFYRAQLIHFPGTQNLRYIVHVNMTKRRVLEWGAPCPCQSDIPYGECCGLYI